MSRALTRIITLDGRVSVHPNVGAPVALDRGRDDWRVAWLLKGIIDRTGAFIGLVVLSPLLVLIAVLIRLDSRGSALFRQKRLGRHGEPFWLIKFRTMVVDAEAQREALEARNESRGGVLFKIKNDPRVTPLGRFLRRTSLDELPQLVNILMGQMSLVGPRPLPLRDCALLDRHDEVQSAERHSVRPGLTGPWQVSGRSETGVDEMLRLDLDYVRRWSLARDLVILARTVVVVFTRRGAF